MYTRARRSARWTATRSMSPTSTRSRPITWSSTSSSSTSAYPDWRTSAGSPPRNPTCMAVWPWRSRSSTPVRGTSRRSSASCCTGSARTRSCSPVTTHCGHRSGLSRSSSTSRFPRTCSGVRPDHRRSEAKDPRSQRRCALRHRCARGASAATPGARTRPRCRGRRQGGGAAMTVTAGLAWSPRFRRRWTRSLDPELDQPITELGFVRSVSLADDGCHRPPAAADGVLFAELRLPDGLGRLRRPART